MGRQRLSLMATQLRVDPLDYNLPGMNGLELVDHLRATPNGEHTPIILMSARMPREGVRACPPQALSLQGAPASGARAVAPGDEPLSLAGVVRRKLFTPCTFSGDRSVLQALR